MCVATAIRAQLDSLVNLNHDQMKHIPGLALIMMMNTFQQNKKMVVGVVDVIMEKQWMVVVVDVIMEKQWMVAVVGVGVKK